MRAAAEVNSRFRPPLYSEKDLSLLMSLHKGIAHKFGIQNPYFNYTDKGQNLVHYQELDNGLVVKIGPIGAFSKEEIATSIQEQAILYIKEGTMGPDFPADDPDAVEKVIAAMMEGFQEESRVVVSVQKITEEGIKPVVGVQATFGKNDFRLIDLILNKGSLAANGNTLESSLSTFQALRISEYDQESAAFLSQFGNLLENKAVSLSRLFRSEIELQQELGINLKGYPWIAMAALAVGIDGVAKMFSQHPQISIYDTHTSYIYGQLNAIFGSQRFTRPGQVSTQPGVENTIHRYHYSQEGYLPTIIIGYMWFLEYLSKSKQLLEKNGFEL